MKKLFTIIMSLLFGLSAISCGDFLDNNGQSDIESIDSIEESSEIEIDYDTSLQSVYKFLASEYVVISTRSSFDTVYVTYYYFVDGVVGGIKSVIAFPDSDSANNYYEHEKDNYDHIRLDGMSVINYLGEEDNFYYGYSLEKLLFVLEKAEHEIIIEFDKKDFYKEFNISIAE